MKTYVQIVDSRTGIYQTGMIDEPIKKGLEIENAISHFGVSYGHVSWTSKHEDDRLVCCFGEINDTSKILTVILLK